MTERLEPDQTTDTDLQTGPPSYAPAAVPDAVLAPPDRPLPRRRPMWPIGIVILVALAIGTVLVVRQLADDAAETESGTGPAALATTTIEVRDLVESTEFAGTLLFEEAVAVAPSTPGVVTAGPVEGQILERGNVLYVISDEVSDTELLGAEQKVTSAQSQLSSSSQQYSNVTEQPSGADIASAQASVAQAQQNLTNLTELPSEAEMTAALADLSTAEAAYRDLFDGPSEAELANAESNLSKAERALESAESNLDAAWINLLTAQAQYCGLASPPVDGLCSQSDLPLSTGEIDDLTDALETAISLGQQSEAAAMEAYIGANAAYESAEASVDSAEAGVDDSQDALEGLSDGPTQAERDQALAAVRLAEERLQQLWDGPSEADVMQAEANLRAAQQNLNELVAGADGADIRQAAASVENAQVSLELALAEQAELTRGPAYAVLFYGNTPAWRTLSLGVDPGEDVRALEENLMALGFDADGRLFVDDIFNETSAAAVEAWQISLGLEATGEVEDESLVYVPGPSQVTTVVTDVGSDASPGIALFELTPLRAVETRVVSGGVVEEEVTTQRVEVQAEIDDRDLLDVGTPVDIELPDGTEVAGEVSKVGAVPVIVPAQGSQPAQSYVEVTIALADPVDPIWTGADVDVEVVAELAEDVLTVPVSALLALVEGGYAVEVVQPDGTTNLVGVETGMFSDGYVEITGDGLSDGLTVVVPE